MVKYDLSLHKMLVSPLAQLAVDTRYMILSYVANEKERPVSHSKCVTPYLTGLVLFLTASCINISVHAHSLALDF